ncbi:hypothetical protein BGZ70_004747 [Mortierella alpina]|uniref:Uncharacterized protein n=1 Tax=Mortierella alpina TaxID=64518 RepID=A0A9P6JHY0_MORAP|nr:hypothetical protein BGZ70_004747 [Mortierella alpina]
MLVNNRRNEVYNANTDAGTSGSLMSRLRQSQRQGRVQEDLGHRRSDPDNPFTVRQTPARHPVLESRFRSPDMDSPPGVAAWPAPAIRLFPRGAAWDRDSSSPTLGIVQRQQQQQQQQQRGTTSSSYRYHDLHSASGAVSDDLYEETPSSLPMKRKYALSPAQDSDSDEEQDDRDNSAGNSVLQRLINAGHRPQHEQQQQQQETPSVQADTTGLRIVFHAPSSTTAGPTTPEGFSLFGGQPPRIPDLPGPGQRLLPEVGTFADTPTARLRNLSRLSNNDEDDEPDSLWTSAGRRAVMRLKYGLSEEDVDEDVAEGAAGTQAVRTGEQVVASGSGSGSRANISSRSDHSTAGGSFWVGKQGFQVPSQNQQPRRDVHGRQRPSQQRGTEMSSQERLAFQEEDLGSEFAPADDYEPQQFSDEDVNAESSDARGPRMRPSQPRGSVVNARVMKSPLKKDSALGEKVAAMRSDSQEISPEARMLRALEAELERAMIDHQGKEGAEDTIFDEETPFDRALDLSTDVLLRDLSHEHEQPLTSPDELELRSWMFDEGQIGRPQRVGRFGSSHRFENIKTSK